MITSQGGSPNGELWASEHVPFGPNNNVKGIQRLGQLTLHVSMVEEVIKYIFLKLQDDE